MGLNVKAAMLICLGFISGMTWLVNRVARPIVELESPLVVRGHPLPDAVPLAAGGATAPVERSVEPAAVAGRFARPSALEQRPLTVPEADERLALVDAPGPLGEQERVLLPPLHIPTVQVAALPESEDEPELASSAEAAGEPVAAAEVAVGGAAGTLSEAKRYRVRRGDCLTDIVRREWRSNDPRLVLALLEANPHVKDRPNHILVGEELTVPDLAWARQWLAAAGRNPAPAADRKPTKTKEVRSYTIRKRDCLVEIARRFLHDHRRWREIAELNGLRNADRIFPGMRIKLPPLEDDAAKTAT